MNIKPLGDRLVVTPVEAENKTASGIIIPDVAKQKENIATVVKLSQEVEKSDKNQIKEGDRVLYKGFAGEKIEIDKKEYIILNTEDILAIL